jgi:23S rRNA (pseudouridine1915-N3)-methyltransferase
MLTIIAIGKKHEDWIQPGLERYQKRLRAPFNIEWVLLPHSSLDGDRARQEESGRIIHKLVGYDYVLLLDERGRLIDSPTLSSLLSTQFTQSRNVAVIIGGAFGVTDDLRSKATMIWSLSPLVFPHQLVRLLLVEQLYRTQEISAGGKYHHE